ncbi:MAG: hypothetical protein LC115_12775 [Bacteroidia bacterium]|nr:hypothetical protein [Bacteroidia bacterium]
MSFVLHKINDGLIKKSGCGSESMMRYLANFTINETHNALIAIITHQQNYGFPTFYTKT